MQFLDALICLCILGWALLGGITGLLGQLSLILALFVSYLLNATLGGWIRSEISPWFEQEWVGWLVAYIFLFVLSILAIRIVAALLKRVFEKDGAKSLDTILGAVFGAIKGLMLAMFIVLCLDFFAKPEAFDNTTVAPHVRDGANWLADKVVDREELAKMAEDLSERIREHTQGQSLPGGEDTLRRLKDAAQKMVVPQEGEDTPEEPQPQEEVPQ